MPLKSKQTRKPVARPDWFPVTSYMHFDGQMSRANAERLVTNEDMVARHAFLPLITFTKVERRYRRSRAGSPIQVLKRRKLAYPSNRDACVFAYYSHLLIEPYERFLDLHGLGDVVIGYRKIGSNIELAMKAFADIKAQSHCIALAFDISNFFDRISHAQLKKGWQDVLGCERLRDDHFAVFKALTRFSTVDRRACLKRLGLPAAARDKELKRPPLCSIDKFRDLVRGDAGGVSNLVVPWIRGHRVPQGTPLSAMAANISMLDFDLAVNSYVQRHGGFYRRYSDDILVVVPARHRARHGSREAGSAFQRRWPAPQRHQDAGSGVRGRFPGQPFQAPPVSRLRVRRRERPDPSQHPVPLLAACAQDPEVGSAPACEGAGG